MSMLSMAGQMMVLAKAEKEADFFIHYFLEYQLFGHTFYLTSTHISLIIVTVLIMIFTVCASRKMKHPDEVPGTFQNIVELIVEMLDNMVRGIMGENARRFVNYLSTVFIFILISNISGLLGLRAPTADYGVTFPLAVMTWVLIQFNGFKYQKFGKIKALFEPIFLFFPMNLISEFSTPVSMSLRLFGNILSGTVMMGLIYGLLPRVLTLVWPAALHAYLDVFSGAIQTYVFCMLTMCFVSDAIGDEI